MKIHENLPQINYGCSKITYPHTRNANTILIEKSVLSVYLKSETELGGQ
jgi:hypothetical protein